MYINKVILFGNLTRDPELRALPSGLNVANFSIATNRVFKDKDGKKQEQTDYHNVVVFGRQADIVSQYLKKGSSVYIEGRLQTRSWDKNGEKQYRTEVITDQMQFGPRASGSGSGAQQQGSGRDSHHDEQEPVEAHGSAIDYPKEEINTDDIPF